MNKKPIKEGTVVLVIKEHDKDSLHESKGKIGIVQVVYSKRDNREEGHKYAYEIQIKDSVLMGFYKDEVISLSKLGKLFYT
jgi:hypothetical protein